MSVCTSVDAVRPRFVWPYPARVCPCVVLVVAVCLRLYSFPPDCGTTRGVWWIYTAGSADEAGHHDQPDAPAGRACARLPSHPGMNLTLRFPVGLPPLTQVALSLSLFVVLSVSGCLCVV